MSRLAFGMALCVLGMGAGVVLLHHSPVGLDRFAADTRKPIRRRSVTARIANWLGARFGPAILATMGPSRRRVIAHRLDAAGHPGGLTLDGYAARKAAAGGIGLIGGLAAVLLLGQSAVLVAALGGIGWFGVDLRLAGDATRRQRQIDRDLPDFLDILTVTVGAGLTFRAALERVADHVESPVSDEVRITLQQMRLGASRRVAFNGLRGRADSPQLQRFVRELVQAEELGAPLSDALATIAEDMRRTFGQEARRNAARAQPKVSLVITMLVVPGATILVLGGLLLGNSLNFGAVFGG